MPEKYPIAHAPELLPGSGRDQWSQDASERRRWSSLPLAVQRHHLMTDPIKSVLMELASWAWGRSAVCWPSNATIAFHVSKHPDTVRKILRDAEDRGFIMRTMDDDQRRIILTWKLTKSWDRFPASKKRQRQQRPELKIDARVRELRAMPYAEYLVSPEWRWRRDREVEKVGGKCQVCNSAEAINVHHRTYRRLGNEASGDLIVLCRDCHETFHRSGKLAGDSDTDRRNEWRVI